MMIMINYLGPRPFSPRMPKSSSAVRKASQSSLALLGSQAPCHDFCQTSAHLFVWPNAHVQ